MKKIYRSIVTLLTAAAMTAGTMSVTASAAEAAADTANEASGKCGKGLLWEVDGDTLYIRMDNEYKFQPSEWRQRGNTWFIVYSNGSGCSSAKYDKMPWEEYSDDIKNAVLEEGIINICSHLFDNLNNLVNIELPSTCGGIASYAIPDSVPAVYLPFNDRFSLSENCIGPDTTIYGYKNSCADFEAIRYDLNFDYIGEAEKSFWTVEGQVGSNATWYFDTATRTLEITGTGKISKLYPFGLYYETEHIVVSEGITEIDDTFVWRSMLGEPGNWDAVKTVSLPDSLEKISEDLFQYMPNAVNIKDNTPISEFKCDGTIDPVVTDDDVTYGDANLDGNVGVIDIITIQKYCSNSISLNEDALKNADVTLDGRVNMADCGTMMAYLLKHINKLPWPYDYITLE